MKHRLWIVLLVGALLVASGIGSAQTLSQQVLQLLSRVNSWTAAQTFTDITVTGTCTGCVGVGAGTVTSVGLALPTAVFDITGSPVTGSGTLTGTFDNQTANNIFAGPSSGGAAAPTFRALVDDDIPNIITLTGSTITWSQISDFTGSGLDDLATADASQLDAGKMALARLTTGGTVGQPLLAGATDPAYGPLSLSTATSVTGQLVAASFPILTGDITTVGGSLATDLSSTGVVAAVYGSATTIPQITVDDEGRITLAASLAIGGNALLDASRHTDTAADAPTRGSVIYGNASNQWDELVVGAAGTFLRSDGTDVAFGTDGSALIALDAANISTNQLALARGGSNASLTAVNGGVVYSTATAFAITAAGTVGQCLLSNGAAAPTWGACATLAAHNLLSATHGDTVVNAVTRGSIIYGNATPNWDELAAGGTGTVLRSDGTDIAWSLDGSGLTSLDASSLTLGTVPTARLPVIGVANGGTGITTYAVGDLLSANTTTTLNSLAAVATGQVLASQGVGVEAAWSGTPQLAEVNLTTELNLGGTMSFAEAAPTISAGFGTSPSITAENGTVAFRLDVGTGGAATSGTIGLPTAVTGWNCWVDNLTAQAANDADERTVQTSSTTTTAVVENQTISTGAAVAWTASDVLLVSCFAY